MLIQAKYSGLYKLLSDWHYTMSFDYTPEIKSVLNEHKVIGDVDVQGSVAKLKEPVANLLKVIHASVMREHEETKQELHEWLDGHALRHNVQLQYEKYEHAPHKIQAGVIVMVSGQEYLSEILAGTLNQSEGLEGFPEKSLFWLTNEKSPVFDGGFIEAFLQTNMWKDWFQNKNTDFKEELTALLEGMPECY